MTDLFIGRTPASRKNEVFSGWERRRVYCRAEPWRANAGSNGEENRAVQANAYTTHTISMMCCDRILFPIFRSSFFCHMEAMKVYISGQSAVGTEDPAFIAEGIHDLMNGGDDFLIGSVH